MGINKILIVIVSLLILIIIGGGIGVYIYLTKENKVVVQNKQIEKKINSQEESISEIGPLFPLEPITVNLKTIDNKDVYLKVTFSLELSDKTLENELNAKIAVIRDHIILLLSTRSVEDVTSMHGKIQLSRDIKQDLNKILVDGTIKNVYIDRFIIQ